MSTPATVGTVPRVHRRRSIRRRRKREARKPFALPRGFRVYTVVRAERPEPDRLPRRAWAWAHVIEAQSRPLGNLHVVTSHDDLTLENFHVRVRFYDLYIENTKGHWTRLALAARTPNKIGLWWYGGKTEEDCEPQYIATELDVHAYKLGFVPRPGWRLFSNDRKYEAEEIPFEGPKKIWTPRAKPVTDDEFELEKFEASRARAGVKRMKALAMVAQCDRVIARTTKRRAKWQAKAKYYERRTRS